LHQETPGAPRPELLQPLADTAMPLSLPPQLPPRVAFAIAIDGDVSYPQIDTEKSLRIGDRGRCALHGKGERPVVLVRAEEEIGLSQDRTRESVALVAPDV